MRSSTETGYLLLIIIICSMIDVFSTYELVIIGGLDMEYNPIMRYSMEVLGVETGLLLPKIIFTGLYVYLADNITKVTGMYTHRVIAAVYTVLAIFHAIIWSTI